MLESINGKKILVVDDEEELADLLAFQLEDHGMRCEIATSGLAAIELLSTKEYDAVVSDVRMNNGSGVDILKAADSFRKVLPIILVSGFSVESKEELLALGASQFLEKPVNADHLVEALVSLIGSRLVGS